MTNKDELTITKKDELKGVIEEVKKEISQELKITSVSEAKEETNNEDELYIPIDNDNDEDDTIIDDIGEDTVEEEKVVSASEELKITSASSPPNGIETDTKKADPIKLIEEAIVDAGMGAILTENEEKLVDGFIDRSSVEKPTPKKGSLTTVKKRKEEDKKVLFDAENLLNNFKNYITGVKFDKQCETAAKKHGIDKKLVKNKVVGGFLGTIANVLGLTLTITGDIIMSAVNFIAFIINKILDFAIDNLLKLINLLTLNCGSIH